MNSNAIIRHPEVGRLLEEKTRLSGELAHWIAKTQNLVYVVKPHLLACYQMKMGAWELRLLKVVFDVARLKRKLALAQISLNQGRQPDWTSIDGELELEFIQWEAQLKEAAQKLEAAKLRTKNALSVAEDKELKVLYFALVKRLHPDINPEHGTREALLWMQVQAAYESGNLEEMKALEAISSSSIPDKRAGTNLQELMRECENLQTHIQAAVQHIKTIQSAPPFTTRQDLENEQWVGLRRSEIEAQISEQEEKHRILEKYLSQLTALTKTHGLEFDTH